MKCTRKPLAAVWLTLAILLTSCTEQPPRYDLPPPSRAPHFVVEISQTGKPELITPYGPAGSALGGALAGGYSACWLSLGLTCVAAPVVMPITAAVGLMSAATPATIAQFKTVLAHHDVANRLPSLLSAALIETGSRRDGYRFVTAAGRIDPHAAVTTLSLVIEWQSAGMVMADGQEVFEAHALGTLDRQETVTLAYRSDKRAASAWLMHDGAAIEEAMHAAAQALACDMLAKVFAAH